MLQVEFVGPTEVTQNRFLLNGIDVFTKYLFAVPLTNRFADTVEQELTKMFFQHSCIPRTTFCGLGTNIISKILTELAILLEVKLTHAPLKHVQSTRAVEQSHRPLKRILKIKTEKQWKDQNILRLFNIFYDLAPHIKTIRKSCFYFRNHNSTVIKIKFFRKFRGRKLFFLKSFLFFYASSTSKRSICNSSSSKRLDSLACLPRIDLFWFTSGLWFLTFCENLFSFFS